jgi:hypothetical protein
MAAHAAPARINIEINLPSTPCGVELTIDPVSREVLVANVLEGELGEIRGLQRGHQLASVGGTAVTGLTMAQISKLLQGKSSNLTFICHSTDNPNLWARMLSHGTKVQYKTRDKKKYKSMFMWADCHNGTLCWAPERNSSKRLVETLRVTDITEISDSPPTGPRHEAHQKRLDMLHHVKTHATKHRQGFTTKEEKADWVKAEKRAHKSHRSKKFETCIEIACYHDGYMIYDHTKDLKIEGSVSDRNEWLDALEWYHRVCRKHQIDVIVKRFRSIDTDHSGDIDISELKQLLPGVQGSRRANQLFAEFDTNGDGKLQFDEFARLLDALEGRKSTTMNANEKRAANAAVHG